MSAEFVSTPLNVGQGATRVYADPTPEELALATVVPNANVSRGSGVQPLDVRLDAGVSLYRTAGAPTAPSAPPELPAPSSASLLDGRHLLAAVQQLAWIKSEAHSSTYPVLIRDRLVEVIAVLEWALAGQVSHAQPPVVPGVSASSIADPAQTKVEFFGGPGSQRMG